MTKQWQSIFGAERDAHFRLVERLSGSLSLCGSVFIIVTFLCFPSFNKSFNRLAFYASFGNIFASLVALISLDGPRAGSLSGVCQFQGFLVQMMMPADAYWILAMAVNVHLVFFRRYTAGDLRRLEWWYIAACYGVPAIPAITLLFVSTKGGVKAYGDAAIWCWIGLKFDNLRLPLGYAPVGITIILVFVIHIRATRLIWLQRRRIQEVSSDSLRSLNLNTTNTVLIPSVMKTTHVQVTHSPITAPSPPILTLSPERSQSSLRRDGYSVNIEFDEMSRGPKGLEQGEATKDDVGSTVKRLGRNQNSMTRSVNRSAIVYFRCALLFFVALVVTWVPSFANRLLTTVNPHAKNYPLALAVSILLPLQGFWNSLIYTVNSHEACLGLWEGVKRRFRASMTSSRRGGGATAEERMDDRGNGGGMGNTSGPRRVKSTSESMRSLKGSGESTTTRVGHWESPTLGRL